MSWWNNSTADDLRRRLGVLYAVSVLLIAGSIVAFQHYFPFRKSLALPDKPSLVVLPLTNASGDPEQEYFSDGMTTALIGDFFLLSNLFVITPASAFVYKRRGTNAAHVSQELGVRYVVKGEARKTGDHIEIIVRVVDTTARCYLWAECYVWTERYARPLTTISTLHHEIVQQITALLDVRLTADEQQRLQRIPTTNIEAYDAFLRAYKLYGREQEDANARARQLAEQALALDPQFAAAYALLGSIFYQQWLSQWSQTPQTLASAFVAAQQAISRDDCLSSAYWLLAYRALLQQYRAQAIRLAEQGIVCTPNSADAYGILGFVLNFAGNPEESIRQSEKAIRLNPHRTERYALELCHAYWLAGRPEEAVAACEMVLADNADHIEAHVRLAVIYSESGQEQEAQAEVQTIAAVSANFSLATAAQWWPPYKDQTVLPRILTALQKAGLK